MITLGKRGDLHARRRALRVIRRRHVAAKVFDELAERYRDRPGGYTRVVKLGRRVGDAAPLSIVELMPGATTEVRAGKKAGRRKATTGKDAGAAQKAAAKKTPPPKKAPARKATGGKKAAAAKPTAKKTAAKKTGAKRASRRKPD
jgi:large subunit ribosomal protein L17